MIVPMKKVSLVVMEKNRDASLEKLREAGVLHLEKRNVRSDGLTRLLDRKAKAETALGILRSYPVEKNAGTAPREVFSSGDRDGAAPPDLTARVLELGDEKKALQEQLLANAKERSRVEKWGNFDPRAFAEFAQKGVVLIPYELSPKGRESLPEGLIVLGQDKTTARVLSVGKEIPGESPWALPERSLAEIDALLADIRDKLADIEDQLRALALRKDSLEGEREALLQQIEFETARAGMETVENVPAEFTVSWITGFVPREDLGVLKRAAAENGWALMADDPEEWDPVPTKLKNNRLVSLIYPLTDFLETLPGYNEVDISGWFLFFFCIFFGMIFGDAGYGLLLMLIGIIAAVKTAKKGVPAGIKMLLLLSFSNLAWGVLTCTWFGMDTALLPDFLKRISLPLISGAVAAQSPEAKAIVDQNLMIFCFSLALAQLSVGHIIGIIRNIKTPKFLGELGSLGMLAGMFNVVLALVVSNDYRQIPFLPLSIYLIGGGFLLSFVFANYAGNIGTSILESFKNIIPVVLGIANVFSDIMSYIRLWAVGLAGASISSTVNTLAGPLLGNFLVFLGIILLVFGHGLNLILNVLSVLVHGVRLNTLEFSSHVGLAWSGVAYKPFVKTDKGSSR
ncbi:MAG: V-type ATP synthase subunit I [Spirochaetaceae bacterium]|jgi:V/A-type H+-transporting ATPase subunit I|nr:V-type ATP synthase subunit I [Spirochaetaceae bacterium]